ncbi:ribosomal-protein-alanine N-acetyltransferase [Fontibacillus phaseoli]|uniref:Ribosomal-protein-alanine N-acetyltransferase n=1 Tax=Fontibacillus phaseoli TaxID=1416533 RepID=A0A369BIM3_9BACL|nr:GNAT family N-acetyltransferase [Fontibacillus phaseoli]RCX21442.1 ribosomal-protein-alanine N-acetyltransferase [Fontibacillus phaseoli]
MNTDLLFSSQPVFETGRLLLRKLECSDAEDFFDFSRDPMLTEHVRWDYHHSIEDARAFLNSLDCHFQTGHSFNWGIVDKAAGKVIGRICLFGFDEDHDRAEMGYAVSRTYWNRGIATEASRALIKYGFMELGLNRIEARCNEANFGSEKVMQNLGMTFEGLIREQLKIRNEYKNQKLYSILRREFLSELNQE